MVQQQTTQTTLSPDYEIYENVLAAIDRIVPLRESHTPLDITVENGVVTIKGVVFTETLRRQVLYAVATTPGVRKVIDMLWDDLDLRAMAARELARDPLLQNPPTAILTRSYQGALALSGTVSTAEQRDRAVAIAASLPGVRRVVNNLVVKGEG